MADHDRLVTLKTLRAIAGAGGAFACLTCYDALTAHWLAAAGVHLLLVGDTAAEIVLGYDRTIHMPLGVSIALTAGVKRGAPGCVVMADMPFMSYQSSDAVALKNAGKYLTQARADIVKLELDASFAGLVRKMTRAGIPVCAHIGSKPQHAALTSGYSRAGKSPEEADRIVEDAVAMEKAGAAMLLVEAVPDGVTRRVLDATDVPVIGIGAGAACHGQVLVLHDLLGMTKAPPPFAKPLADIGPQIQAVGERWVEMVRSGRAREEGGGGSQQQRSKYGSSAVDAR